jgi:antitoxin component YwqK of YwqJK toxin-antitoxin module
MAKVVRTYHDDEQTKVREEYFEINGKKEGIYKSYHENGKLEEICNYIDGKKEGEYKYY